jgi:mRNA degradation ribonuclease J1/J2
MLLNLPNFLLEKKLSDRGMPARIEIYDENLEIKVDNYTYTPVRVTHSIQIPTALLPKKIIMKTVYSFISDFKFDLNPLYEPPFNYKKVNRIFKDSKFNVCLMDSTNILNNGKTTSESELVDDFEKTWQETIEFLLLYSHQIFIELEQLKRLLQSTRKKLF